MDAETFFETALKKCIIFVFTLWPLFKMIEKREIISSAVLLFHVGKYLSCKSNKVPLKTSHLNLAKNIFFS